MEMNPEHHSLSEATGGNRVLLLTAEPLLGNGIRALVETVPAIELVGLCHDFSTLARAARTLRPNVILLDMPADACAGLLHEIHSLPTDCRVLVLTGSLHPAACYQLQMAGIAGVIRRTCRLEEFVGYLIEALYYYNGWVGDKGDDLEEARGVHLSRRERELVSLVASGLRNKEIAAQMGIAENSVKAYLSKLFRKLGVEGRLEIALLALREGEFAEPARRHPAQAQAHSGAFVGCLGTAHQEGTGPV